MIYLIAAYIAWCLALYFYWQDKFVFPGYHIAVPDPIPSNAEIVVLKLDIETGGQIEAWFIPAPGATAQNPGPAVLFFHGNAENIMQQSEVISRYHSFGCSVFLPEYRGYGNSAGKPSEKAVCADAVCFYDELVKRPEVDKSRIIFHGRSLGGGVAVSLAMQRKPAALVLQSTFKSLASMAYRFGVPPVLVRNPFRTDRAIVNLNVPILIFHGARDMVIPVSHGRKLRDLARGAEYIEYNCGHNDFPGYGNNDAYWSAIRGFLARKGILKD